MGDGPGGKERTAGVVAIVDHGLGNLFSVASACAQVGLQASITNGKAEILAADAVILPGVGAFGDAMATLRRLDLISLLRDVAQSQTPLMGICLGIQLLMTESEEFGQHQGLGVFEGSVVRLDSPYEEGRRLKIPHVGWTGIRRPILEPREGADRDSWADTLLGGLPDGVCAYFVHSYVIKPVKRDLVLSTTSYGSSEFCSSISQGNVFACQFHPERSGPVGLKVYRNLAARIQARIQH